MPQTVAENARIRISLSAGELEIEGSEEFVSQYADSIDAVLDRLRNTLASSPQSPTNPSAASAASQPPRADAAETGELPPFGEVLHSLASKSGTDQILLAGFYASVGVADGTFATSDASRLLVEQGVKLSNPSQSLKNNLASKRVFKVGSRFKISRNGIDYLKTVGVAA